MATRGPLLSGIGRGALAGLVGSAGMTAFQKLVEMPFTRRGESDAPARFVERVLRLAPRDQASRRRLNYLAHLGIGALWGAALPLAERRGLRGQRRTNAVFAIVYVGDLLLNMALGLYRPSRWSAQDWAVDVVDKYVLAQLTGAAYDRLGGSSR